MTGNAFVAVGLSDAERHALSAALRDASPGTTVPGRRPPVENWHLTLRFLGQCSDVQADSLMYELAETMDVASGRIVCTGLSAFPKPSNANVVYCTVEDADGMLDQLAGDAEAAAQVAGFEPEERPFIPHLTLSRLRPAMDVQRLIRSFGEFRVPIAVREVTLYRSLRNRSGVYYDPYLTAPLI